MSAPRGPVTHNFADSATAGLPEDETEVWNLIEAVDEVTQRFCVCIEIVPAQKAESLKV
jgi:hypothetical protein